MTDILVVRDLAGRSVSLELPAGMIEIEVPPGAIYAGGIVPNHQHDSPSSCWWSFVRPMHCRRCRRQKGT